MKPAIYVAVFTQAWSTGLVGAAQYGCATTAYLEQLKRCYNRCVAGQFQACIHFEEIIVSPLKVFVYGTLKPGECNYLRYCTHKVVEAVPAIARGRLFSLPVGYPAMIPGDSLIHGVLLSFADAAILHDLDDLEDYNPDRPLAQNEYYRCQIEVFALAGKSQLCEEGAHLLPKRDTIASLGSGRDLEIWGLREFSSREGTRDSISGKEVNELTSLGFAWAYLMEPDRVRSHGGVLIPSGWWAAVAPPFLSDLK